MLFLCSIAEAYSKIYETERRKLDKDLVQMEMSTGVAVHVARGGLSEGKYRSAIRAVHQLSIYFVAFEFLLLFWIQWVEAVSRLWEDLKQPDAFSQHVSGGASIDSAITSIEISLGIVKTKAYNRLEQFKMLQRRLQVQERVLNVYITTSDTFATISLGEHAEKNSESMKIIALITMLFLPGAYVSGILGMAFFNVTEEGRRISATDDWWIFLAVTLPLTALTIIVSRRPVLNWLHRMWTKLLDSAPEKTLG
ncbi:hypothetical protein ABW19_dt0200822 [Dactylella cylindrospora]|nr:hypothetical protein ABW19_dt0200822 [Dactylella cylindrospora]